MSTLISDDQGDFIKVDGVCYQKAEEVEGPPNISGEVTPGYTSCEECEGGGPPGGGSGGGSDEGSDGSGSGDSSGESCVFSYIPCPGQNIPAGESLVRYVECDASVEDPNDSSAATLPLFARIGDYCWQKNDRADSQDVTDTIAEAFDSCEDCAPYIWYEPTCTTDQCTQQPLVDPLDASISYDTRTASAPYNDYDTAPDTISYFGNCYTKVRLDTTAAVKDGSGLVVIDYGGNESGCLKDNYNVIIKTDCDGQAGASDIVIDPSFLAPGTIIKVTATQTCYTVPAPDCTNVVAKTGAGPCQPLTAFEYRTTVDWSDPDPGTPPQFGDVLTCGFCNSPGEEGSDGGEGPPGGGGSGGAGSVGGSLIPESSASDAVGSESISPEVCELLAPEVYLLMLSGTYIGQKDEYTDVFDMTTIVEGESITNNSGHVAVNHPVITSMTVTEKAGGLVDIEVEYAYAPADNQTGPGSVLFEDVPQVSSGLYLELPGLAGDTGGFQITLVSTECAVPSSSASSAASSWLSSSP